MSRKDIQTILLAAIVIVGLGLVFVLSDALDARRGSTAGFEDEDLYLSSQRMKALSGDFNGLVADWYWINSLQYIGRKIVRAKEEGAFNLNDMRSLDARQLYPMLDRTTTLDPDYSAAYDFGAIILPAIDEEKAIQLTEKGIAANPNQWRLYQQLGYIYWQRADYQKAAEVYDQGSQIEGAPLFMKQMSAKVRLEGGTRKTAREIYRHVFEAAEDTQTREVVALRLAQIDSLDERDEIRKVLEDVQKKSGRCPRSWAEIFPVLRAVKLPNGKSLAFSREGSPLDPLGAAYLLANSGEKCDVELDLVTSKIPPG